MIRMDKKSDRKRFTFYLSTIIARRRKTYVQSLNLMLIYAVQVMQLPCTAIGIGKRSCRALTCRWRTRPSMQGSMSSGAAETSSMYGT
jgi:hypothetical protein